MIPTELHTKIDRTKDRSLHCLGYAQTETALADGPSEGRSAVDTEVILERTATECKCSLRIKLVGDGCAICNPGFMEDLLL